MAFFYENITVSTKQWHFAGQEIQKTHQKTSLRHPSRVPTNSVTECWHSNPQFRNHTGTEMLPTQTIYKASTYCKDSRTECCAIIGVTQGEKKIVSETRLMYYSSPQNISYLPRDMGRMAVFDKKILHLLQFIKHQKKGGYLSKSVTVFCTYRRGGLNWWMRTA